MTLLGPSKYTYLRFDVEQTRSINSLAKEIGVQHEEGPSSNTFMIYKGIFSPAQVKVAHSLNEATLEEKRIFGAIFTITSAFIQAELKWPIKPEDISEMALEKTVDFTNLERRQACKLSVRLSEAAALRLGLNERRGFSDYYKGSPNAS